MGEADEDRRSGGGRGSSSSMTQNFSLQLDKCPTDLLQRFISSAHHSDDVTPDEETQGLELNLGLSLGGRFGVDKSPKSKLIRSSSIAGFTPLAIPVCEGSPTPPGSSYQPLFRTSSLPTETEEEWRKRKELQTLRRMAAKKRRLEKQRSFYSEAEKEGCVGGGEEVGALERACNVVVPPFSLSSWAQAVLGSSGSDGIGTKGKAGVLAGSGGSGVVGIGQQTSQGSAESQGGSSSGMSESDSRLKQGSGSCSGTRSPANYQLMQDRISNESAGSSSTKKDDSSSRAPRQEPQGPSKKAEAKKQGKEIGANAMEDMPCVFTKGDGPNGRRIEGILYKYGKGEDVRIMCVCHGSFLSPVEFVKHAGGGDVAYPLKHIVINPNPTFMR